MIDILLKDKIRPDQIRGFIAESLDCNESLVVVCDYDDLLQTDIDNDIKALVTYTDVTGDAKLLVAISRYKMEERNFIDRLSSIAIKHGFCFYIPYDGLDEWLLIGEKHGAIRVRELPDESDDGSNSYFFEPKNSD